MKKILLGLFLLLLAAPDLSAQTVGYLTRSDCAAITTPTEASVACLQTTTTGGRTAGHIYIFRGGVWVDVDQAGAGGLLTVPDGGTGRTTLTNHGVLIGASTGAINATTAGTAGQVLTSNGPLADPTFQSIGGTVSNIATTSPITGGPITSTGSIACPTCSTAASALVANQLVTGGGGQALQSIGSTGLATQVLHGNPSGSPTWGAVNLSTDTTGTLAPGGGGTGQTAVTDDAVLVGNGTVFQAKVLPDCDDTGGQHLNYDTATNTFACGTSGGGGGSSAFSAITTATNTTATMTVGTGASMLTSGSGTITASHGVSNFQVGSSCSPNCATIDNSLVTGLKTFTLQNLAGTIAMLENNLGSFAATTSLELATLLTNETGTGAAVFGTAPTITGGLISAATLNIPNSTTLPATCVVGDIYQDNNATTGQQLYLCESTNTWALQSGGGGGGSFAAISTGTNTTAVMTVGTGASIVRAGTGIIDASLVKGAEVAKLYSSKTTNPTTAENAAAGYANGDMWINTAATPDTIWLKTDETAGSAVWTQTFGVAAALYNGKTVNPTAAENTAAGYNAGDMWVNTTASPDRIWLKTDESAGTAVWVELAASSGVFSDTVFQITDNVDPTKIGRFETGLITTGTTRIYTLPNSDGTMALISNVTAHTLDNAFDAGKIIDGANSLANAFRVGDGTTPWCIFTDASDGPIITPCTDSNVRTRIPTNFTWALRDVEGAADVLTVDPDSTTKIGMYTFGTNYKPLKTIYLDAGSFSTDGTQCAAPAEAALNTNKPKVWSITCADNDAGRMTAKFTMPAGWDGGTIRVRPSWFSITSVSTNIVQSWSGQCVRDGDAVADVATTGEQNATLTFESEANETQKAFTAAITLQGTCAGGATIYLTGDVDAAGTTHATFATNARFLGAQVEYAVTSLSD